MQPSHPPSTDERLTALRLLLAQDPGRESHDTTHPLPGASGAPGLRLRWSATTSPWRLSVLEEAGGPNRPVWLLLHDLRPTPCSERDWLHWLAAEAPARPFLPWPYGRLHPSARIGASHLVDIRGIDRMRAGRLGLVEALLSLGSVPLLTLAGHGRAGTLACVLAPWLDAQLCRHSRPQLRVISFGAPTAGDAAFADGLATAYGAEQGRCYSAQDPVSRCWGDLSVLTDAGGEGIAPPPALLAAFNATVQALHRAGLQPAQPAGGLCLPARPAHGLDWIANGAWQHRPERYLELLLARFAPARRELPLDLAS